jgi:hypothetical protein
MNDITEKLKARLETSGAALEQDYVTFELLTVACSGCCEVSNSGNGGCPPPKLAS